MESLISELTDNERAAVCDAMTRGTFRAVDNRSDGCPDNDALGDARRVGQRIADGFALLNGES